jgi:ribosomal protein S18 acetylase RimI-like enzyme
MATGLFTPAEADMLLRQTLSAIHAGELGPDHAAVVYEDASEGVLGWVYFAKNANANQVWDLWWIGVDPSFHARGVGTRLLHFVEQEVARRQGRVLIIETGTGDKLKNSREFYLRRSYLECGTIPHFYGPGEGKVTFARSLVQHDAPAFAGAIEAASHEDVHALSSLAVQLAEQHQSYDAARFPLSHFGATRESLLEKYTALFMEALESPHASLLVYRNPEGRVDGYTFTRFEEESLVDLAGPSAWIHDLFVASTARGHGVGERLLLATRDKLRSLGATSIMLSVSPKNAAARALFQKHGFLPTMIECRLREGAPPDPGASVPTVP